MFLFLQMLPIYVSTVLIKSRLCVMRISIVHNLFFVNHASGFCKLLPRSSQSFSAFSSLFFLASVSKQFIIFLCLYPCIYRKNWINLKFPKLKTMPIKQWLMVLGNFCVIAVTADGQMPEVISCCFLNTAG
jgi:hypothetical protein